MTTSKDFTAIPARKGLGTIALLDGIRVTLGLDEYGRSTPRYIMVHQALLAYRDALRKRQTAPPGEHTPTP